MNLALFLLANSKPCIWWNGLLHMSLYILWMVDMAFKAKLIMLTQSKINAIDCIEFALVSVLKILKVFFLNICAYYKMN